MTRALLLYAHPCDESFASALHVRVRDTLEARGWEVDDCDLYAEGFQPVLTAEERRAYHDVPDNRGPVEDYVRRLERAEALVLVFPVWNFGFPAILKGFFDRVFLPGVSFHLEDGDVRPGLTQLGTVASVTTYGATRMRAMLAGDPPRRLVTRVLRGRIRGGRKARHVALYDMNNAGPADYAAFLARVEREMARL